MMGVMEKVAMEKRAWKPVTHGQSQQLLLRKMFLFILRSTSPSSLSPPIIAVPSGTACSVDTKRDSCGLMIKRERNYKGLVILPNMIIRKKYDHRGLHWFGIMLISVATL